MLHYIMNMLVSYPKPEFKSLTDSAIKNLAINFANEIDYKPKKDLIPIIEEKLNGKVEFVDDEMLQNSNDGSIIVHGPKNIQIFLTKYNGPLRDRFTLAHELGHYVIHSEKGKFPLMAERLGNSGAEWEANMFAAELLMPESEFRAAMNVSLDNQFLAANFLVSLTAAHVRKEILIKRKK